MFIKYNSKKKKKYSHLFHLLSFPVKTKNIKLNHKIKLLYFSKADKKGSS